MPGMDNAVRKETTGCEAGWLLYDSSVFGKEMSPEINHA